MAQEQWKYVIRSGKMPVVLMFIMSAIFAGIAIWLHSAQNGVFIFAALFAAVMLLVFFVVIYRFLFYRVLIGKDGFFYQTSPGNGKHYNYTEVEEEWISAGTAQNGSKQEYCNIAVSDGSVIRFPFYHTDSKGVEYLVKRVEESAGKYTPIEEKREYIIDGKVYGKARIVIGVVLLAIVAFIDAIIIKTSGLIYMVVPGAVAAVVIVWKLIVRYLCFKVHIGKNRFYFRTNPFNGQYYEYGEIAECREIKKVIRNRAPGHIGNRSYYFYFEFTDVQGNTLKFQFEKPIHEYEINVLKERIEKACG